MNNLKERKAGAKISAVSLLIFLALYTPSLFHWAFGRRIETDALKIGVLEDYINTDCLIVRDEEAAVAPVSGTLITGVEEGEKVPKNYCVALIVQPSAREFIQKIEDINRRIAAIEREEAENRSIFSSDYEKLDQQISGKLEALANAGALNRFGDLKKIMGEIEALLRKKAEILASTSAPDSYLKMLLDEKEAAETQLKKSTREINSAYSGIVSFAVDGYEGVLTSDSIQSLSPSDFKRIIQSSRESLRRYSTAGEVEVGKAFMKVIKDIEYEIATYIPSSAVGRLSQGSSVRVRINELGRLIRATVSHISEEREGQVLVILKSDHSLSECSGFRSINADIIIQQFEGYKIPISSLKNINQEEKKATVVLVRNGQAVNRDVRIVGSDGESAIIENWDKNQEGGIRLHDIYVIKPINVEEGQFIAK